MDFLMVLFAKYLFLLIVVIFIGYFFTNKKETKKKMFFFALISLPLTFIIAKIISMVIFNPRPFVSGHFTPLIPHAMDNGFPSDHSLLSFALGFIILFFKLNIGVVLLVFGAIVGISRIYVGVHSPIDILGSFVIAFFVAKITHLFFHKFNF